MTIDVRVKKLALLGKRLQQISNEELELLISRAKSQNAWFTNNNIKLAWNSLIQYLDEDALTDWVHAYNFSSQNSKTIALVMAGNIPLVGFHDLLCVLIAGYYAQVKTSSKDSVLITYVVEQLEAIAPELSNKITFVEKLKEFDAVIATGSDNASRYFTYYFGKYPHIIRKNRTSCAILTGNETELDIENLGMDLFSYFGLGCRNVSKVYIPQNYDFTITFDVLQKYKNIIHHHKYANNYDYQKSIMLVNKIPFLDNGFVMFTSSEKLVSPISVVFYESYNDMSDLEAKLHAEKDKIQCIVGSTPPATVPFGQAQFPMLQDYADRVDTLQFLLHLN